MSVFTTEIGNNLVNKHKQELRNQVDIHTSKNVRKTISYNLKDSAIWAFSVWSLKISTISRICSLIRDSK